MSVYLFHACVTHIFIVITHCQPCLSHVLCYCFELLLSTQGTLHIHTVHAQRHTSTHVPQLFPWVSALVAGHIGSDSSGVSTICHIAHLVLTDWLIPLEAWQPMCFLYSSFSPSTCSREDGHGQC